MSENNTATGQVIKIMDLETFVSGFSKRCFVVETAGRYPQPIMLECWKDRAKLLDTVRVGDTVTAAYNLNGRENNGRYYVSLTCWKIDATPGAAPADPGDDYATVDYDENAPF